MGSLNWGRDQGGPLGELITSPRPWRDGSHEGRLPGDHFCGEEEWFVDGIPAGAPVVFPDVCCGAGHFVFRGNEFPEVLPPLRVKGEFPVLAGNVSPYAPGQPAVAGVVSITGDIMVSAASQPAYSLVSGQHSVGNASNSSSHSFSVSGHEHAHGDRSIVGATSLAVAGEGQAFGGNVTVEADDMLTGGIMLWGSNVIPSGYLLCDGTQYAQATYPALYAVIGTTFGTPTAGNFCVPDMRGRAPVGKDLAGVVLPTFAPGLGTVFGEENHALVPAENASHNHANNASGYTLQVFTTNAGPYGVAAGGAQLVSESLTGNSGSGTAHNNCQPSLGVNYIIKT